MVVRAKFRCTKKDENSGQVELEVVTSGSEENKEFFRYTPSGRVSMGILNPGALAQFDQGAEYYLDFFKADPNAVKKGQP